MPALRGVALAIVVGVGACREPAPPPPPPRLSLADYLGTLAGTDQATRTREVASWELDLATWDRTVVATYRAVHADYARAFQAATPALVARVASRAAITTRPHHAGDPRLTLGQARARWALPVLYPSEVAELDGVALDVVFVRDGERWRALAGLDAVIHDRTSAIDPACAAHLENARSGECNDVGWVIAEAAILGDARRFAHACALASNLCAR